MKRIEDLKKIWNVKIGGYYFSKKQRDREWYNFLKRVKKEFSTPDEAYNYYHLQWFGWERKEVN